MARKHLFLTILSIVLLTILLLGCGSTPTPDPSIVWSDDFEDGDTEGWEEVEGEVRDEYSVDEGILSFGYITGWQYAISEELCQAPIRKLQSRTNHVSRV